MCRPSSAGPMLLIHCDKSCSHALSSPVSSSVPNSPEPKFALLLKAWRQHPSSKGRVQQGGNGRVLADADQLWSYHAGKPVGFFMSSRHCAHL